MAGSAVAPMVASFPLTVTRPARMSSSHFRRDAMPAWARIFWTRSFIVVPVSAPGRRWRLGGCPLRGEAQGVTAVTTVTRRRRRVLH